MPEAATTLPKIRPPLEGKEFLAASHFRVGYDRRMAKSATKRSIFKKDFVPHVIYDKSEAVKPPDPAQVMHSDLTFKPPDSTVTQDSYQGKVLPKVPQCTALTKTNFKMDSDKRVNSFYTSHSNDYSAPSFVSRSFPMANPMRSYVPQGDPQKEKMPVSDYRGKYPGHDTSIHRTERAPCMHTGGPSTILGDNRTHEQFSTSACAQFPGFYLPYVAKKPNLLGSDIPCGDMDKVIHRETTQLSSFAKLDKQHYKSYQRDSALTKIGGTNFKMGHNPKMDKFQTCSMDYYSAKEATKPVNVVTRDSNASSFPEGDRNPERVKELVTSTTYGFHHKQPPKGFKNPIIRGADKRTASKVTFAEPSRSHEVYSTTQSDDYPSIKLPGKLMRASGHPQSKVPLDYYAANGHYTTTTLSEYPPWKDVPKHVIAIGAVNELRKSNMTPPLHQDRYFDTTHLTTYTAKRAERFKYDSSSLQKSSLPLGTMTI
ncbi:Testis-expressed protein 45 [Holothuria leucospilota]|uniref:Testis-expressed protein 45 n=1 Tax=Holothuria leucospilota TaxID=206669 RepID=A0A9Q1H1R1_HOLLE|nr:Testis-expressed protein 45 [Holothuria leucospilota]